jgi:hypothetical protein
MNRDAVLLDQAAGGDCHLCGRRSGEKPLLLSYKFSPLIHVRIAVCLSAMPTIATTTALAMILAVCRLFEDM